MKFAKTKDVKDPQRGTELSAGIDFFVPNTNAAFVLKPNEDALIPSGIKVKLPKGFALIAFDKSGVATKRKLKVGACVVDEDYQGEIHIHVFNLGSSDVTINPGDKLVQFLLLPINYAEPEECDLNELYESVSERGEGGFGSTGIN